MKGCANRVTIACSHRALALCFAKPADCTSETVATLPENRERVSALIADAPGTVRCAFRLTEEDGKIVWGWPRLTLIAR